MPIKYCCAIKDNFSDLHFGKKFDWIITKDVLEHMEEKDIDNLLTSALDMTDQMFHVIPLGDNNGKFVIPAYELDKTHIQRNSIDWWIKKFQSKGWNNVQFSFNVRGVKDNWTKEYEHGNGFFVLKK